jgi:hypothetical protein
LKLVWNILYTFFTLFSDVPFPYYSFYNWIEFKTVLCFSLDLFTTFSSRMYLTSMSFHIRSTETRDISSLTPSEINDFCEIVIWMEISISAKLHYLWPRDFWEQTSKVVKRLIFCAHYLRKSILTCALIKIQCSFFSFQS